MPVLLLVDDDADGRASLAALLDGTGFRIVEAGGSVAALAHIREQGAPRLMVADAVMPGSIDGYTLVDIVSRCWPETAIILCSDEASPHVDRVPCRVPLWSKPIPAQPMLDAARSALAA
jgi:CheY-like chemotaxis protein